MGKNLINLFTLVGKGIFDLQFEQYYLIENNKAYVLTFICETSEFSNFKKIGEDILNSFSIKGS